MSAKAASEQGEVQSSGLCLLSQRCLFNTQEESWKGNWVWKEDEAGDRNVGGVVIETVVDGMVETTREWEYQKENELAESLKPPTLEHRA